MFRLPRGLFERWKKDAGTSLRGFTRGTERLKKYLLIQRLEGTSALGTFGGRSAGRLVSPGKPCAAGLVDLKRM